MKIRNISEGDTSLTIRNKFGARVSIMVAPEEEVEVPDKMGVSVCKKRAYFMPATEEDEKLMSVGKNKQITAMEQRKRAGNTKRAQEQVEAGEKVARGGRTDEAIEEAAKKEEENKPVLKSGTGGGRAKQEEKGDD